MKTILIALLLLTSCTSRNQHGQCIGLAEDPKPELTYEVSWWNVMVAIVFSETGIVPFFTAGWYLKCPTGLK